MFERSLVDTTLDFNRGRRLAGLPLSAAAHVVLIVGVIYASAMHVEMPTAAPARVQPFQVMLAPPIPAAPAPPRGNPATAKVTPHTAAPPVTAPPMTAPSIIPATIPVPQAPVASVESGTGDPAATGPVGLPTGIPGGTGTDPTATGLPGSTGVGTSEIPLPVTGNVRAPVIITRVDPHYPELLLRVRMRGSAIVECIVDAHGKVQSVVPVFSTHKLFEAAAVDAVRKWMFKPGSVDGRPVPTIFRLTVKFEPR
ncbi:MAG TPA: TonB family protein [Thermoanaerobaculia bacterium]|nr:TonB family protein [Thermoanaerobaculia bacterium]